MKVELLLAITLLVLYSKACEVKQCGNTLCNENSFCLNNEVCLCPPNFVTISGGNHCCYEQKRQMKAFLLEFFVSFGAGHFYTGRTDMGIAKVMMFCFLFGLNVFMHSLVTCYKKSWKHLKLLQRICLYLSILCCLIWQIVDLSNYGRNEYRDSNGINLVSW